MMVLVQERRATTTRPLPTARLASAGLIRDLLGDPPTAMLHLARKYGPVVQIKVGSKRYILLSDPDDIREVLVVNPQRFHRAEGARRLQRFLGDGLLMAEGAAHIQQRRAVQPTFHHQMVQAFAPTMVAFAEQTGQRWHDQARVDMTVEMIRLTLGVIAKRLFDVTLREVESRAFMRAMELFAKIDILPFGDLVERLPLPVNQRLAEARADLNAYVYGQIDRHRASANPPDDLLTMLLGLRRDGEPLSDRQVRDEAMGLFLAGHDTTASALSWTWYLLAQHPVVEARLHAELAAVLGGRAPTAGDLPQLPYLDRVLSESLRLYPPAWSFARCPIGEYRLGDSVLPGESTVIISPYVVHHDPRWYPDPFTFDPERWTPAARAARPKFAYIPFGGGPHLCIGEPFAWMEATIVLATLARHWHAALPPSTQVGTEALITLRPRGGIPVTLHHR